MSIENADDVYFAPTLSAAVQDSIDRSNIWLDMAREVLKLGFLGVALRAPPEFHRNIAATAHLAKSLGEAETQLAEKNLALMKKVLNE